MNLQQLLERGGVVTGGTHLLDTEWTHLDGDGKEITDKFKVHVRKISYTEMQKIFGKDAPANKDLAANAISQCIRLGDAGDEALTYEQALSLDPGLTRAFMAVIKKATPSVPKT